MEINYITNDKSIHIRLEYLVGYPLRMYYVGKTYPRTTQCLMYMNGIHRKTGTVIKHKKDEDNPNLAIRLVTKKALSALNMKCLRDEVWKLVLDATK